MDGVIFSLSFHNYLLKEVFEEISMPTLYQMLLVKESVLR